MKTIILTISFIMLMTASLQAQSGWYTIYNSATYNIETPFFTSSNTGYVAGWQWVSGIYYPRIYKTTNAGANWTDQPTPQHDSDNYAFRSIYFTDANTGFAAVANINDMDIGRILKTTNGGINWVTVPIPVSKHLTNIYFINSSTGFASGYRTILKTTDGGNNWVAQNPPFLIVYFEFSFTNVNTGYLCGNNGKIIKTTDGGANWYPLASNTFIHLWGLSFADANTGIAVGGNGGDTGIILRTTNAGDTWTPILPDSNTDCILWSVRFVNTNTGWASGGCGQILKTTNSGLNWFRQGSYSDYFMRSYFLNTNTGYIVGPGKIIKTTDGGGSITGNEIVNNEVPAHFQLFQNYPNPFNPSTMISFDLPKPGIVKLVVFDVTGKEINVLVNEFKQAGKWDVEFDASAFSSGVYFYKLVTDDFTDTKKMILVK